MQALVGAPALAQPAYCKEAPAFEYPGAGFVGRIDPAAETSGLVDSPYQTYGYAGHLWFTYDTGCFGSPSAATDTWVGNQFFNAAKLIVATTNAAYSAQIGGSSPFAKVDQLISSATVDLYQDVYLPWVGLILLIAAVVMFRWVLGGNLAAVGKRVLTVVGGLAVVAATYLAPLLYTQMMDNVLDQGIGKIHGDILKFQGISQTHGLPTLLHHKVVYDNWLAGEFGGANTPQAKQFGRQLLDTQACSHSDYRADRCTFEEKQNKFKEIVTREKLGPAYANATGAAGGRTGVGIGAFIESLCFAVFQLACSIALFLAKAIFRVIVFFGVIIGLVAFAREKTLPQVGKALGGALVQGIILAVVSGIHLLALNWVIHPARDISSFNQILIMTLLTAIVWVVVRPIRRLVSMMTQAAQLVGVEQMPFANRMALRQARRAAKQSHRTLKKMARSGGSERQHEAQPEMPPKRPEDDFEEFTIPALPLKQKIDLKKLETDSRFGRADKNNPPVRFDKVPPKNPLEGFGATVNSTRPTTVKGTPTDIPFRATQAEPPARPEPADPPFRKGPVDWPVGTPTSIGPRPEETEHTMATVDPELVIPSVRAQEEGPEDWARIPRVRDQETPPTPGFTKRIRVFRPSTRTYEFTEADVDRPEAGE